MHYLPEGYTLQGKLLAQAIIKLIIIMLSIDISRLIGCLSYDSAGTDDFSSGFFSGYLPHLSLYTFY